MNAIYPLWKILSLLLHPSLTLPSKLQFILPILPNTLLAKKTSLIYPSTGSYSNLVYYVTMSIFCLFSSLVCKFPEIEAVS